MEHIERGAKLQTASFTSKINMYFRNHINDCKSSFNELSKTPTATLMTLLVIGIALALPGGLHLMLKNSQIITSGWDNSTKMSLFLSKSTSQATQEDLMSSLKLHEGIAEIIFISADKALLDFQSTSGFGDAITLLATNPLPDVIEITPTLSYSTPEAAAGLLSELEAKPGVDIAQLDLEWVRRFHSMIDVAKQTSQLIAVVFGFAVLLVIGNTIRLAVQNKKDEIEIIKLVGATDGFIQRPFLYSGIWYGLAGGLITWLILSLATAWMEGPINQLVSLYDNRFELVYLSLSEVFVLLATASFLGLAGSWASVSRHLKAIQPH